MTDTNLAVVGNQPFRLFRCPTCKMDITSETMHGWVRDRRFGPETNWKQIILPCPTCSDQAIARQMQEQISRLLGASRLPIYAQGWNFATTPGNVDKLAVTICANYANEQGKRTVHGLFLFGDPGVGKTGLAISIMQAVMERGLDALFIRSLDLMNRLRASIAEGTHEGDELLNLVKRVRWLVLDDLATERPTPYVIEQLYAVIEERRACGLYTVITSNYNLRELEAHWRPDSVQPGAFHAGKRITERINEYCLSVHVKSSNLRKTPPDEGKIKPIRGN